MTTLTFLLDFDNTLADNDRAKADQDARLCELLGAEHAARFWQVYEDVRRDQGCVDYLGTLQRYVEVQPNERDFADLGVRLINPWR